MAYVPPDSTNSSAPAQEIESAMDTGQGADDEPSMTVGDKHAGEPLPDPNRDGVLTVDEAETLLGGDDAPSK